MSPGPLRDPRELRELRGSELPSRIRDIPEAPPVLYVHGDLPRGASVAIVGTRHPTASSSLYARHLAGVLAAEGVAILSGGAIGIDTAAHRGALDVGGVTVVVAPCGFDHPYPEENAGLYRDVVTHRGGYVSATRTEIVAKRPAFFLRNRLMVALAHAVVLVEAPWRSGALNTASHARVLGRPLFVVPHPPWNLRGQGSTIELKRGGRPLSSPRDILRELTAQRAHPIGQPTSGAAVPPPLEGCDERDADPDCVSRAIAQGLRHPDEIAAETGLSKARVQRALLTLRLKGVLVPAASRSDQSDKPT